MALTISEFTRRLDGTCERSSEPEEKQRGEKMSEMNEREKGGGGGRRRNSAKTETTGREITGGKRSKAKGERNLRKNE